MQATPINVALMQNELNEDERSIQRTIIYYET